LRLLTASWVVPVVTPPLKNGRVAVEDGRIAWVGPAGDERESEGPLEDLGNGVLLPGLVNAHCHLELSHLRGLLAETRRGFVGWVGRLVEARTASRQPNSEEIARAVLELVDSGTVAVGDVSNRLEHLDLLEASGLVPVVFHELLAWDPLAAPGVLREAERRHGEIAARRFSRTQVRLAAHAPHSVSAPLMKGLVAVGGPAAIHLAESAAEVRFLATANGEWSDFLRARGLGHVPFTAPGQSPTRYLDDLGALHAALLAAHCVHVDAGDRRLLAERGVSVAVCPRSNRNLGVGIPPVPELLADGVRVCLGTDSLASVPTLDLIDDMAALHREFPSLDPAVIVRMATLEGAGALGLADLGSLAHGKTAAMAFAPAAEGLSDPLAFLVSGNARTQAVRQ
jgi:cytosine/adenosine deaminase-related metal-dependent hydrolase